MDKNELRNTINEFSSYANKILSLLNRLEGNLGNTEKKSDLVETVKNIVTHSNETKEEKYSICYPVSMLEWLCEHDDLTGYKKPEEEKCVTYKEFEALKEKQLDDSAAEKNKSVTKEIFFNKANPPFQKALKILLKLDNLEKEYLWAIPLSSEGFSRDEIRSILNGGPSPLYKTEENKKYLQALEEPSSSAVLIKDESKYKMIMEDNSFNSIVDEIAKEEIKIVSEEERSVIPHTQIKRNLINFFHSTAFWQLFYSFVKDNIYCNDILSKSEVYEGLETLNNCKTFDVGEIILFLNEKKKQYEELFSSEDPLEVVF